MRAYALLAILLVVTAIGGWLYWSGHHNANAKAANKSLKAENKAVAKSNDTSRQTQERVDVEGADTRQATQTAQEGIRERIQADPKPSGRADADILRIATQAHQRAIRAACRVQRTGDCP